MRKLIRFSSYSCLFAAVVILVGSVVESATDEEIQDLIARLGRRDYAAKHRLTAIGLPVVKPLFEMLSKEENQAAANEIRTALRWIAHYSTESSPKREAMSAMLLALTKADQPLVVRQFAVELLGIAGRDEATPTLAALLSDDDLRRAACESLEVIPAKSAAQALAKAIKGASPETQAALLRALGTRRDPQTLPEISAAARSDNGEVRLAAIEALGKIGETSAVPTILEAIEKGSEKIKRAAVTAYLRVGDAQLDEGKAREALTIYRRALDLAADDSQRAAALSGVGRVGDPASVAMLLQNIEKGSEKVKAAAVNASLCVTDALLRNGKSGEAVNIYNRLLDGASQESQRIAILTGMGRAGSEKAIPKILPFIEKGERSVAITAVKALHKIPGKAATESIANALKTAPNPAKCSLLSALAERRDKDTISAVIAVVKKGQSEMPNSAVCLAAINALSAIPDPASIPTLLNAVQTGSNEVKAAAVNAYLRVANAELERGRPKEALAIYHNTLDIANRDSERAAALVGISKVASRDSIPKVERLLDKASGNVSQEAVNAYIAIADKLATDDRDEAIRIYQKALDLLSEGGRASDVAHKLRSLGVKMEFASRNGIVNYWWLLGSFSAPNQDAWDKPHAPETEDEINLDKEYNIMKKSFRWRTHYTPDKDGRVNLDAIFKPNDNVGAYAYAEIVVEKEQDVHLKMGSDDGIICWLNGERIHSKLVPRSLKVDEDDVPAHLMAGTNRILLKILEGGGQWEFCLRITDEDGKPVDFKMH